MVVLECPYVLYKCGDLARCWSNECNLRDLIHFLQYKKTVYIYTIKAYLAYKHAYSTHHVLMYRDDHIMHRRARVSVVSVKKKILKTNKQTKRCCAV